LNRFHLGNGHGDQLAASQAMSVVRRHAVILGIDGQQKKSLNSDDAVVCILDRLQVELPGSLRRNLSDDFVASEVRRAHSRFERSNQCVAGRRGDAGQDVTQLGKGRWQQRQHRVDEQVVPLTVSSTAVGLRGLYIATMDSSNSRGA
jgi:hypothetical protein